MLTSLKEIAMSKCRPWVSLMSKTLQRKVKSAEVVLLAQAVWAQSLVPLQALKVGWPILRVVELARRRLVMQIR